ncbi:MAG: HipA domain-containing protein [Bacteroidales bacterium]|nr:HipA domain-containing protein [Bacteroidales bacterium]MCF8458040.1 HipA domain-containing protein [Bacteroidales bacterium]
MEIKRCLYCYKELSETSANDPENTVEYHSACSRKIFGKPIPPKLDYTESDMLELALQIIKSQKTVPGVQAKLSLNLQKQKGSQVPDRFTIVGLWGEYILKPPRPVYPSMPEIEDLTMHLAEQTKIKTASHSLIRLTSGQLAYITKRIDRKKEHKLHMEDMCQLTERLSEHKYKGSYEQVGKVILKYTTNPGFDIINFYELLLFCFLTGNNDMHLKNFSLLKDKDHNYSLCPAYDLLASELLVEGDDEELALNLNGRKKKIKRRDFVVAMKASGIDEKAISNVFKKFEKAIPGWTEIIDHSFLPDAMKLRYLDMIDRKIAQVEIAR